MSESVTEIDGSPSQAWYTVENAAEVPSPALLIYPERVVENVRRMISIAGGPESLRPHVKTHKVAELVRMQQALGIHKFKCATIAEAEMVASCGPVDVLLAYQPVGPNIDRLMRLIKAYPQARISAIADDPETITRLAKAAEAHGVTLPLLLDIDCGMHRSGVEGGAQALGLYKRLSTARGLQPGGLHVYDGHIHESDLARRTELCHAAFAPVSILRGQLIGSGLRVPRIVAGGTPTFPIHARRPDVECSPGTCLLWDWGYAERYSDMAFEIAALLLTRVVSKPGRDRLCLDLGHKAVAAENPPPRLQFLNLPDAREVMHSEEHLVVETAHAQDLRVGDCLYAVPRHICPTVALHAEALAIIDRRACQRWRVSARDRALNV